MIAASEKTAQKLKTHWNEYLQRYDQYVNQKQIDTLQARIDEIEKQIDESDYIIKKTVSDYSILSVKVVSIVGSCLSGLLILTDHGSLWNILLIAMVCICLDVICYNNMFGIVEIIYMDLYELSAMEKTKISKLLKERSKLTKQINELK